MLESKTLNTSQKIILLTATACFTEEHADSLKQLLKSQPDWQFIRKYTEEQGTASFIYKIIKKYNFIDSVPTDINNHFQNIYFQTQAHNILALEQLKKVLSAFSKEAIKTILLKGIASAEFIYKDLGLRPMGDIDILVEPNRLLDAEKILFGLGYKNDKPYKSFKLRNLNIYKHLNAFINNNINIELHRELNAAQNIYRIPSETIWKNIVPVNIQGESAYILNTEINLQYLSVHSITHFIQKKIRLNNFVDISELLKTEKNNINWIAFEKECNANKVNLFVHRALTVCKTYLDAPVPDVVIKQLNVKENDFENQFLYLLNDHTEKIIFKTPSNYFKKIIVIDGFSNKLKYLWAEVFPSKEYIIYSYKLKNKKIFFVYYFIQFFGQVTKSFRNIFFLIKRIWKK